MHTTRTLTLFFIATSIAGLTACGNKVIVDGFAVQQKWYDSAVEDVAARAAYDLNCPRDEITLTIINSGEGIWSKQMPTTIGANGCSQRGAYARTPTGAYILNGSTMPVQ